MDSSQPSSVAPVVVSDGRVTLELERSLYPLDAIYGASYSFIDRCFVLLDAPDSGRIEVELRGRALLDAGALQELAGEFTNELLTQAYRQRTAQNNRLVIEAVTARAMSGALGVPDPEVLDEQFDADAFDDPLGIAVPWEEKYGARSSETSEGRVDTLAGEAAAPGRPDTEPDE